MKQMILFAIFNIFIFSGTANWQVSTFFSQEHNNPNDLNRNELSIYPNPTENGWITLELKAAEISEIRLINIAGKELITLTMEFGTSKYLLSLTDVPNGIYFVRVKTSEDKTVVKKLVVSSR